MASMNVKVPTKKVITSLEKRLAEIKARIAAHDQYRKDIVAWRKSVLAQFDGSWKVVDKDTSNCYPNYGKRINVTFEIPKAILSTEPKEPIQVTYEERNAIPEIESAIRVLKMTDEETVSASTFKSVSRYL